MAKEKKISYLRKVAAATGDNGDARLSAPDIWEEKYPAICEYMTAVVFGDGSPREPSTLTFCVEDGKLKGCVNDRAGKASLWRSGDSMEEVLEALEAALRSPQAVWRRWRGEPKGGAKKN